MVDNKFVTVIKTKANIFSEYFPEQCIPFMNNIVRPINQRFLTQSRLTSLAFSEGEIFNEGEILKNRALNLHKAHGHDDISIRKIKICDK